MLAFGLTNLIISGSLYQHIDVINSYFAKFSNTQAPWPFTVAVIRRHVHQ